MFNWPSYPAHTAYCASARGTEQLWRLVIGLCVGAGVFLLCNQVFYNTIFTLGGQSEAFWIAVMDGSTPLAMFLLLFSFVFMIVGTAVAVRVAHNRSLVDLLSPFPRALGQFMGVLWILVIVSVIVWLLPPWNLGEAFVANLGMGQWVVLLPLSLLAVLVQTSAEEILFRGYIQRQLAARFSTPWVWMVVPSLVFGLGHYTPETAGSNAVLIALLAVVFGLLMADLTARSGSLGPAIAVHFVNNVPALLIVAMPDEMSGLALFLSPFSLADEAVVRNWLAVDFAWMLVSWLAARLAIRR